jgi:hypothetical protein
MEQITYLLFIRRLDDLQSLEENKANRTGKPIERRTFPEGKDPKNRPYEDLRCSRFKHFEPKEMYEVMAEHVFPFLRTLGGDAGSLDFESCAKDLLQVVKTKKTELLFLALIIRLLKPGGRAAVIVPDGVLFGSSTAHKTLRKMIVEDQKLDGIIPMPGGVFKPYAGVSTAILLFTKTNSGGTDYVWFYDMQADGKSLDDIITDQSAKTSRSPGNPCEFRARSARALEAVLEKAYLASKRPLNALEQSRKLFFYTLLANQKLDIYV